MSETKTLPTRAEVPEELTWNLELIYPTEQDWESDLTAVKTMASKVNTFTGKVGLSASNLSDVLVEAHDTFRKLEKLYVYASMKSNQDNGNNHFQGLLARVSSLAAKIQADIAFMEPEIIAISDQQLQEFLTAEPKLAEYSHYLDNLRLKKTHVLDASTEALLSGASEVFEASSQTFSVLSDSDLEFPYVEDENGDTVQLSNGLYGALIESTNRDVRHDAFTALYSVYDQFQNTLAQTLTGNVKSHNFMATAHHYPNARAAAMAADNIPESVYDTLIKQVDAHLPLLHRYVALRKQLLGVDELHMYDMYVPLTGEPPLNYTYDQAKVEAKKALAVLGQDYLSHVDEIFNNRYIDVVENKGKTSGAYSGGAYDTAPYELLNWQDSVNSLYTLVHETGHSVHSWYTRHSQPYQYGDYPIFLAEIASTTNENLLTEYLLKTQTDPKVRAYLLNYYLDGFKGTVFRQTQFAEFEHFIHTTDAAGQPLTADVLDDYYGDLNARYYGPAVAEDPEIALEWSRIPHFYYNYYVYQYATGFAAASSLSRLIMTEGQPAVERYLNFLKSGSSDYAINTMKKAGLDMTKPDYLEAAFAVFEKRLNELESLIKKD
ncbi:oligoendopeptidase F [Lapidilactobacillus bayanensis]|uniref:oligoendopeptidase F n=1 Tax=Lapidilactobacillus bayanensis TaxID=2485998 RepID=UPI000F7A430B|nr:oligoendopeptidase F [Lapidilactobacillus bayanensis]